MNLNYTYNIEWKLLRGTLIFILLCFVVGVLGLVFSYEYKITKVDTDDRLKIKLLSLNSKDNKSLRDIEMYEKFLPQAKKYMQKGYIGEPRRVLWVDILHNISFDLKISDMQYHISEQTPYVHKGKKLPEGDFFLSKSIMSVSMNLFHEGDLFLLLDRLNDESESLYYIDQCSIRRNRMLTIDEINEPNLSVQCDLTWISLQYPQMIENVNE